MIIRSQDKKHITTDMNLEIVTKEYFPVVGDGDSTVESKIYNSVGLLLGTYSTEEKAIKVLDMICEHTVELHFSTIVPDRCGEIYGNVFNMPQDNEV